LQDSDLIFEFCDSIVRVRKFVFGVSEVLFASESLSSDLIVDLYTFSLGHDNNVRPSCVVSIDSLIRGRLCGTRKRLIVDVSCNHHLNKRNDSEKFPKMSGRF
jgi:hypothetical protein